ncbi:hypothetical protein E2562_002876 [Oryza meyeriana var. granulata]|uniref:Guanine nucleotide-binding protein alpha subunit n=6 Tax=BOP clade TaxID=359160 RepID=A0A6G1DDC4_9ORYZ|nr:hypothetical protein E2562_002876 [Oryza meyeriana var. granulata]
MGSKPPHGVSFKLVLLGDGRVGKTSLVLRYVNDVFSDKQEATVQASYLTKRLVVEGVPVTLSIWDTAGQEKFHALGPIYYRDADAALLVYDITDNDTFLRVTKWVKELKQMANKDIVMAIAANKSDLVRLKNIDTHDAASYAESIGAPLFVTSAKAGTGIDDIFSDIARRLLEKRRNSSDGLSPAHPKKGILIVNDEPEKEPPPRSHSLSEAETAENAKSADIDRRILQETKAEQHIHKLLLLGAGESGKSTIFKQIKLLFQTGFDEAELRSYTSVIHANVYQTIKILYDGAKELSQVESDSSKYVISPDNQEIGEKLSEIDGRLVYPLLNKELVHDVKKLWQDPAIQETYSRGSMLQLPDCAQYFMENLDRLAEADYVPTKEDVLYARVRTNGVVQIQFSPVGENKRGGEVYRLYDVGGQRNERRKWIHLFEGVNAVIFCAAISEYDQMLFEDETKNRMMETKELFDWVLKQRCFEKTSFMLFLNKFDIFERKIQKVPLSVCEWFKDYQPIAPGKQEVEHAYEFVKKKFEELYFQSSKPDRVDRVFKIYRTTALDQKLVKKTFKLIDESMRRSREGT